MTSLLRGEDELREDQSSGLTQNITTTINSLLVIISRTLYSFLNVFMTLHLHTFVIKYMCCIGWIIQMKLTCQTRKSSESAFSHWFQTLPDHLWATDSINTFTKHTCLKMLFLWEIIFCLFFVSWLAYFVTIFINPFMIYSCITDPESYCKQVWEVMY